MKADALSFHLQGQTLLQQKHTKSYWNFKKCPKNHWKIRFFANFAVFGPNFPIFCRFWPFFALFQFIILNSSILQVFSRLWSFYHEKWWVVQNCPPPPPKIGIAETPPPKIGCQNTKNSQPHMSGFVLVTDKNVRFSGVFI